MTRECHVRFCESGRGRFPPALTKCVLSGCRRRKAGRKATSSVALLRESLTDPARSENHGMYGNSIRENREVPGSPVGLITERAAQETLRRYA